MKIFDSIKNKKWTGRGIEIKSSSLLVMKSAKVYHPIPLRSGTHTVGMLGKKRTGDGKLTVEILNSQNNILIKKEIKFSGGGLSEYFFEFNAGKSAGPGKIRLTRTSSSYGSIEIGRLFIKSTEVAKKEIRKAKRNWRKNRIKNSKLIPRKIVKENAENIFERKLCFIIPYGIYGGGEIYLQNIINNIEQHKITILYIKDNKLKSKIKKNVYHKVVRSLNQARGYLIAEQFDHIIYYNRADIYKMLSEMKIRRDILSKLTEVYHSDFTWAGSLSLLKYRKAIDKFIVISESLGKDIDGINEKNRVVLPTGINLRKFQPRNNFKLKESLKINQDDIVIGTVSRLSKEKRINYILDLAKKCKEYKFVIVGDGPERNNLLIRKEQENISNVIFAGFQEDTSDYYNIFDGFLLASKIEGIPISILEAMASGVPVFSNFVGAIPDIVQDEITGYKITGNNILNDIEIIKTYIHDKDVVFNARRHVEKNHEILEIANRFLEILEAMQGIFVAKKQKKNNSLRVQGEFI